jgi:type I restriction enzyme S subunit
VTHVTFKLEELCEIRSGGTPSRTETKFYEGAIPWAKIDDLNVDTGVVVETKEHITPAGLAAIRGKTFEPGTILFAMYGSVGKKAWAGVSLATNQAILGLRVLDKTQLDSRFLWHWLTSQQPAFARDANGVTQKNLSAGYIRSLDVPQIPIVAQHRIAVILDKADSLRRKRQEAIRLADDFLRAAYLDFANKHPGRASVESILADIPNAARTGPFGSQMLVSEFTETGIPVLGIDNVVSNTFTWGAKRFVSPEKYKQLERYTVRPGDVMVTIMGTTGRVVIAPDDLPLCISTKHLCTMSLDPQKMCPSYLWACLRWDPEVRAQTQRESKGAIMEGWNMGIVKGLMVSKPPMEVQLKFAALLNRMTKFVRDANKASDETDALIAALSAQYLNVPAEA